MGEDRGHDSEKETKPRGHTKADTSPARCGRPVFARQRLSRDQEKDASPAEGPGEDEDVWEVEVDLEEQDHVHDPEHEREPEERGAHDAGLLEAFPRGDRRNQRVEREVAPWKLIRTPPRALRLIPTFGA
jgi:hypothetical protein